MEFAKREWRNLVKSLALEAETSAVVNGDTITLKAGFDDVESSVRFTVEMEKLTGQKLYSINDKLVRKPN